MTRREAENKVAAALWGRDIPTDVKELAKLVVEQAEALGFEPPMTFKYDESTGKTIQNGRRLE